MRVKTFKTENDGKVVDVIMKKFTTFSYNQINRILRKKDIKVNGKRICQNCQLAQGDEVTIYFSEDAELLHFEDVYEDENILVVFKKRGIETVSETGQSLIDEIKVKKDMKVFAVHRLDRNTQGLVIFAKNETAKVELDVGFKNRTFEKFYLAEVFGRVENDSEKLKAYLKKHSNKSFVEISDSKAPGYEQIQTNYKLLKQNEQTAILEVELVTGKTHQIRAHLAHIGHFIIGDDKYGNSQINRKMGKKYQNLIAFKLKLHFLENSSLYYLDKKVFEIETKKIDFLKNL